MTTSEVFAGARQLIALLGLAAISASSARAAEPARAPNGMAQRVAACTVCHGEQGRATPSGYFPRIAGKPEGYLFNQLVNFREGRRHYVLMNHLVQHLTDDYLREMAQHFAQLDLPYPPAPPPSPPPGVLARGEALVKRGDPARQLPACLACHGERLTGVEPAIPGLLGLSRDYLHAQLGRWQTGERRTRAPDCMARIAQRLTVEEVSAVTTYLAAQPVPTDARPAGRRSDPLPLACGSVELKPRP